MVTFGLALSFWLFAWVYYYNRTLQSFLTTSCYLGTVLAISMYMQVGSDFVGWAHYCIVCLVWLPLVLDDLHSKSVYKGALIFAVCITVGSNLLFLGCRFEQLLWSLCLVSIVMLIAKLVALKINRNSIGIADFYALFAFSLSLPSHALGLWVACFSLLGISHIVLLGRRSETVPLIPFLWVAWSIVYVTF